MIAWATQRVTTSAAVTLPRAFFSWQGRRSSPAVNGGEESVEVAVHRVLLVDGDLLITAKLRPLHAKTLDPALLNGHAELQFVRGRRGTSHLGRAAPCCIRARLKQHLKVLVRDELRIMCRKDTSPCLGPHRST
jgi:hypothetical protein